MTTTIGYAAVQLIPSMEGFSAAVDKQLGGTGGLAGAKFGKDFGSALAGGIGANEAQVKAALDKYNVLYNRHADALGKVRVETAKLEAEKAKGNTNDVRILAQTEKLEAARRKEIQTLKLATDQHKAYEEAQKRSSAATATHGSALEGLSGTASKLAGSLTGMVGALGPLGGALEGAAGSATGLGGSMLSAASGAGIMGGAVAAAAVGLGAIVAAGGEVVSKLYEIGASFNEMSNEASFKTGLTGDALNSLSDSVKKVASETPGSIGKIGNIAADVTRSLHLTGSDLDEVTKSLTNLDVKTGEATNIRDLGKAFRGFSVDAASQNDALNQLYTASTATGQSVNDLIHSVVTGGPAMRELGLSFGTSATLMSTFENAGLDGDKMIIGLRKSLGEFAKEGKKPADALRENIKAMQDYIKTGDDPKAAALANKLFGSKTGVNFFDAIKRGALDLDSLNAGVQANTLSINDMADKTETAGEKWDILKNKVEVALQPLATKIFDIGQSGLTDLGDWIATHQAPIIHFFTDIGVAGIRAFQGIALVLGPTLEGLGSTINLLKTVSDWTGIGSVIDLGDAPQKMADIGAALGHIGGQGGDDAIKKLQDFGNAAADAAKLTDGLGKSVSTLKTEGENVTLDVKDNTPEVQDKLKALGVHLQQMADDPTHLQLIPDTPAAQKLLDDFRAGQNKTPIEPPVKPNLDQANTDMQNFVDHWRSAVLGIQPPGVPPPPPVPTGPGSLILPVPHVAGGQISGPGSGTSDSVPIWASNGEFIVRAAAARKNMPLLEVINAGKMPGFAGGGAIGPDVQAAAALIGTAYSQGNRTDCSGMVARVIDAALGIPDTGLMSTKNAAAWLAARGFKQGIGGPGAISVGWYDHGPNPNDGHMSMTLSDGTNAEAGGKNAVFTVGAGASGASSPQFDHHMFLAIAKAAGSPPPAGGPATAKAPGKGPAAAPVVGQGPAGGGGPLPSSISGLSGFGLDSLGSGVGTTSSGSDLSLFGKAAGAAVSGQVSSALGVFGVGDNPPFLQAATKLIGGIKVSGKDGTPIFDGAHPLGGLFGQGSHGSSAVPLSATSTATGTPPPDNAGNVHGTRAGQAPGPQTVYYIRTATVEDAFLAAQRKQNERNAAKLSRF